jgi:transcriptional regulator with XRE-family HTH domain
MARSRKRRVQQAEVVRHFAARLKELRRNRGYSQATLAEAANISTSYVTRLENGLVAPGIDLVARLAVALGVAITDLLPSVPPADPADVLRRQARELFDNLLAGADRELLQMVCPLLARLTEAPARNQ